MDVDTLQEARSLIETLGPLVNTFKVGSQLFTACGPAAVRFLLAHGKKVFLDLKYHDIPNTVANAVSVAVNLGKAVHAASDAETTQKVTPGIFMYTLNIAGGAEMLNKAVEAAASQAQALKIEKPRAVGITVLTSEAKQDTIQKLVLERAVVAKKAGLDGVVASSNEAALIRKECGKDFIIVTPGIRPGGSSDDDQKRIATPAQAIAQGSNFLVVGRPIVKAQNPRAAAEKILKEIESAK